MKHFASLVMFLGFSAVSAGAQTTPPAEKPTPTTPKTDIVTEAPPAEKPAMKVPKTTKDLDAFFKEGEEQAKDGPRCERPPAPTV